MKRAASWLLITAAALATLIGTLSPTIARPSEHRADEQSASAPRHRPTARTHVAQPFPGNAGGALQVVSVVAASRASTTAALTLWQRSAVGSPWRSVGSAAAVFVGSGGLTEHEVEGSGKSPIGAFSLTRAYGRDANRGHAITRLRYRQLRQGDGWSSQDGSGYNTFEQSTNELFGGRDGWAREAILIDYNLAPVRPGRGSGFFVHVGSAPTAGCVATSLPTIRRVLSWLIPDARPRIVIAVQR